MNSFLQGIPYNLPCLQNECLQGFAVASIESYATRFSDLVKWINESHMFTRGYAKHPCKQIKYSQRVAVRPIRPYRSTRPTANPWIWASRVQGCL
jgi:hypothetical protein